MLHLVGSLLYHYSEIFLLGLASLLFFSIFYLHVVRRKSSLPVNWPIVGMLPALFAALHRLHDYTRDVLHEAGGNFIFKGPLFVGMNFLLTCDPANVNHVFNLNFHNYSKGREFTEIFDILGDGLLNSEFESWKFQRKMAHAILGDKKFRSLVADTALLKIKHGLIPFLDRMAEDDITVDIQDVFMRYTFDTTCTAVFGVDLECLSTTFPAVHFANALHEIEETLLFRHAVPSFIWKLLRWLNIGRERQFAMAREVVDQFILQQISKRMSEEQQHKNNTTPDLLTLYMNWPMGDNKYISNNFLRDTTLTFLAAGSDTVGTALSWFFYIVAKHPNVEKKILDELEECLPEEQYSSEMTEFSAQSLGSTVYLYATLLETLRLFPPVPIDHKGVMKEDILPSGVKVMPGMKILISIYAMGRMESVWGEDCMDFRPERWISKDGKLRHDPTFKFMAFATGPRTCIGKESALTQLKIVAATMIYNFHVELVEGQDVTPRNSMVLQMANGCLVKVKRRLNHLNRPC